MATRLLSSDSTTITSATISVRHPTCCCDEPLGCFYELPFALQCWERPGLGSLRAPGKLPAKPAVPRRLLWDLRKVPANPVRGPLGSGAALRLGWRIAVKILKMEGLLCPLPSPPLPPCRGRMGRCSRFAVPAGLEH